MADEPVVGLLADRAGVEEDQLGVLAIERLRVAKRLEHALHALRVVLVHLAPEGRQVVALHAGPRIARRDPALRYPRWIGRARSRRIARSRSRPARLPARPSTAPPSGPSKT